MQRDFTHICPRCGNEFHSSYKTVTYCSRSCAGRRKPKSPETRFWEHVTIGESCWEWTGFLSRGGYGQFRTGSTGSKSVRAHRAAYIFQVGPIPAGLWVLHRCDNAKCVRGSHLYLGDHAQNMLDMVTRKRAAAGNRNGSRLYPERRPRGANHPKRLHPELTPRGDAAHASRLTSEQVLVIRKRFADGGITKAQLGRDYGVTAEAIGHVILRRSWQHLV